MFKIIFVAPLENDAHIQNFGAPSLGLIKIDSYLKSKIADVETIIYEESIDNYDLIDAFRNDFVDILGISLLHYTIIRTIELIHQWRKVHPESLIVIGGNEAAANYQDVFDKAPVDVAVLAEGEQTMVELVRWRQGEIDLEDVSGIIYRKNAKPIDSETFWEFWKHVKFGNYRYRDYWSAAARLYEIARLDEINCVRLITSSHCNKKCSFCSLSLVRNRACGQSVRPVALEGWQIMELIHRIVRDLPETRTIYFCTDDVFYPDRQNFYDFVDLYEKSGYNLRFLVQTSTVSIHEKDFDVLKRLGCQHITLGVENASERIRKSLNKPQSSEKIELIIQWSKQYAIPIYYLIILIPPDSTLEDLKINYYTIHRWIKQGVKISIEPLIYAYRGAPIYEDDRYPFTYECKAIPGTNLKLKDSIYAMPKDPIVHELATEFKQKEPEFVQNAFAKLDHKHHFKGQTSYILLDLLEELLKKYDPEFLPILKEN